MTEKSNWLLFARTVERDFTAISMLLTTNDPFSISEREGIEFYNYGNWHSNCLNIWKALICTSTDIF